MEKNFKTREGFLLEASEMRYRRLFESAKDGILIIDFDTGMILDVNQFLIDLLGYSKSDFVEKYLWEVGAFKDILASKDKFLELQKKELVRYEDLPLQTKSGKTVEVEFVSNVYLVNNEKTIQCNVRDITERRRMEKKLSEAKKIAEQINEAKTDFLINISHDIRTPMNVISGFTDLLMRTSLNKDQEKYCAVIKRKVTDLVRLLDNILDISAIEKGKVTIHQSSFNVREMADDVQNTCRMLIGDKNIEFKCDIAEDVPGNIMGDQLRLKQILENLCGNAIKYTEKGIIGLTVSTDVKPVDNQTCVIRFCVEDTGQGVVAEQLPHIFEPYTRYYKTGNKIEGVGLGLHIVKTLVKEMGGDVTVISEEGKGSKFSFELKMCHK